MILLFFHPNIKTNIVRIFKNIFFCLYEKIKKKEGKKKMKSEKQHISDFQHYSHENMTESISL